MQGGKNLSGLGFPLSESDDEEDIEGKNLFFFNCYFYFFYILYLHMYLHYTYSLHDAYTTLTCTTYNTYITIQLHQSNWITVDLFTLLFAW